MRLASRNAMEVFRNYHPLFVEGMSGYDPRDPEPVAVAVVAALRRHWGGSKFLMKKVYLAVQ